MEYNKGQLAAISHFKGPALVLAGPGSGKTTVIAKRIEYLIKERGVPPSNILVITFTRAAAMEMQERFMKNIKNAPVYFATFHSFFFNVLKYAYNYNASSVLKNDTKKQILKGLYYRERMDLDSEEDFLRKIEEEISRVKSEGIPLENYYPVCTCAEVFQRFYRGYENELHSRGMLDFDDMMIYCRELFLKREDILEQWRKQFPYILIDEFQDICKVQYEIVKMLAAPSYNLFAVGDDDQSIYGFRGSKPELMLNFEKEFRGTKRITLDMNYRCDDNIRFLAGNVIKHNKHRFPKKISADKPAVNPVNIVKCKGVPQENSIILKKIREYLKNGLRLEDMAVIFRTNTQPSALAGKLMEENIPFVMKDRLPNIFEHWIARDIKAYISIALGSRSRRDYLRIINRPKRYIARAAFDNTGHEVDLDDIEDFYRDKRWMLERMENFRYDLAFLHDLNPYAGISYIRKGIGYDEFIKEYALEHGIRADELFQTLEEIMESAKDKKTYAEFFDYMEDYKRQLEEDIRGRDEKKEGISLVTMHSCKGLEYEAVFLIDANESIMPFHKAVLDEDIEEERRLFYVALTRAKTYLNVFYVEERFNKKLPVSRFLEEAQSGENFSEKRVKRSNHAV